MSMGKFRQVWKQIEKYEKYRLSVPEHEDIMVRDSQDALPTEFNCNYGFVRTLNPTRVLLSGAIDCFAVNVFR
ncbi:hypothetical protein DJ69_01275 [Halorubrum persicum]|uniref:Uncharacterized protein n=1 Tax=Halorubrum persicum TaxID=1383844 RepID=A0A2G1WN49_9EURY|nr:hypothetical protein DJ69_01275 [Halorubrum persicum]